MNTHVDEVRSLVEEFDDGQYWQNLSRDDAFNEMEAIHVLLDAEKEGCVLRNQASQSVCNCSKMIVWTEITANTFATILRKTSCSLRLQPP